MKKLLGLVIGLWFVGSIASIFAWSFFDFVWWSPIPSGLDGDPRRLTIFMFHTLGLGVYPAYLHIRWLNL